MRLFVEDKKYPFLILRWCKSNFPIRFLLISLCLPHALPPINGELIVELRVTPTSIA